jgi:hypothetical protein
MLNTQKINVKFPLNRHIWLLTLNNLRPQIGQQFVSNVKLFI